MAILKSYINSLAQKINQCRAERAKCFPRRKNETRNRSNLSASPGVSKTQLEEEYSRDVPSHGIKFLIEEVYENQILRGDKWVDCSLNLDRIARYTDHSGEFSLDIKRVNDLERLGVCCSRWRWLSDWRAVETDGSEWTLLKDKHRRRRLLRARYLESPKFDENTNIAFPILRKLISEVLIKLGHNIEERSFEKFNERCTALFETIELTAFKKDVYSLFSSSQVTASNEKEAENVLSELDLLLPVFFDPPKEKKMEKTLEKAENLIDAITNYRAAFQEDFCLVRKLPEFLVHFVDFVSNRTQKEFILAINISFGAKDSDDKIGIDPLKLVLEILSASGPMALDKTPLRTKLQSAVKDFYIFDEPKFAESVGDCFKIIAMISTQNSTSSTLPFFVKNTIKRSFRLVCERKRAQFPKCMTEFIEEDWEEYGGILSTLCENEFQFYLPYLDLPGINPHPGENTVSQLIRDFVTEINEFYAIVNPSEKIDSKISASLKVYCEMKEIVSKCERYLSENAQQTLKTIFIDNEKIFCDQIENFVFSGLSELDRTIKQFQRERDSLHKKETPEDSSNSTRKFVMECDKLCEEYFRLLRNSSISGQSKWAFFRQFAAEIRSRFVKLVDALFRVEALKRGVLNPFIDLDRKALGVERSASVSKQSDMFKTLSLCEEVVKVECGEAESMKKRSQRLSGVTRRLCVYYDNTFALLEAMDLLGHSFGGFAQKNLPKAFESQSEWEMGSLFRKCDILLEVLALRISVFESGSFLQELFALKNSDTEETETKMCCFVSKLTHVKSFASLENANTIFQCVHNIIAKVIEWMFLYSDRSFYPTQTTELRERTEKVREIINFFLPKDKKQKAHARLQKILKMMALDDSALLSTFRDIRDKGVAPMEFSLEGEAESTSSSFKVLEKKELTLSSFFEDFSKESAAESSKPKQSAFPATKDNKAKLSKTARSNLREVALCVLSRRRSELCRRFASDNGKKVPQLPPEESESSGEDSDSDERTDRN